MLLNDHSKFRFEIKEQEYAPYTYAVDVEMFTEIGMLYSQIKLGN